MNIVEVKAAMDAGFHRLRVLYFDDTESQDLAIGISGGGLNYEMIPESMLFHE